MLLYLKVSGVSGGYCEILLDWVIEWDQETRERILFEKLIYDVKGIYIYIYNLFCSKNKRIFNLEHRPIYTFSLLHLHGNIHISFLFNQLWRFQLWYQKNPVGSI